MGLCLHHNPSAPPTPPPLRPPSSHDHSSFLAQTVAPTRPRITGISHVAYYVSDMPKAMVFWHDLLGLDISYDRKKPNSTDTSVAFLRSTTTSTSSCSATVPRKPIPKTS